MSNDKNMLIRMRDEWDRRVRHDYRYWMSDGVADDSTMFDVGQRDFDILVRGIDKNVASNQVALELGCGVGRILKPASSFFKSVVGVDVSEAAILEARRLLKNAQNVELVVGNGIDLSGIESNSIDFIYSFAALCSMPVAVIGNYLLELNRIITKEGCVRLQVYLGKFEDTYREDTLAIRSFDKGRFVAAVTESGFSIEGIEQLKLGFEVSDYERGQVAYIVSFKKIGATRVSPKEIEQILVPGGEKEAGDSWQGSKTEYLMAIVRATQHMEAGNMEEARNALEFAVSYYGEPPHEAVELLEKIRKTLGEDALPSKDEALRMASDESQFFGSLRPDVYERNCAVIRNKFPDVFALLQRQGLSPHISVVTGSSGLPVLCFKGTALDNVDKPDRAATVWVERTLKDDRFKNVDAVLVIGFAGGYHLNPLLLSSQSRFAIVEPRIEVLKAALALRDMTRELEQLESLIVGDDGLKTIQNEFSDKRVDLLIHPQTQAISRGYVDEVKHKFWAARGLAELRPSIAVVGPIYGGTLPIARYVERGLRANNQRVHGLHLGGFYEAYKQLKGFVGNKKSVDALESQYVELLSDLVLESLKERSVDILICMAQAPLSPRVLTELRNQGVITVMWFVEDCRRFTTWREIAPYYDYMFLIQKEPYLSLVQSAGAGVVRYLPTACDPVEHLPVSLDGIEHRRWGSDVSFVGAGYNNRQQMFASLVGRDFKIWGTEWPQCHPFSRLVQENGRRLDTSEYVKIFSATKVNINLHSSSERDGVDPSGDFLNPRTFELAACEAFQLVDNREYLSDVFDIGTEVATFGDRKELFEKIDYYLVHQADRAKIAQAGRARALAEHTYQQRVRDMLGFIYADRFAELRKKNQDGPWPKIFSAVDKFPALKERYQRVFDRGSEPNLDQLIFDIHVGKGSLNETELKLLFLHHVKTQIAYVTDKRDGKIK